MTQAEPRREPRLDWLEIVTFRLGGVRMAADVEQVQEILEPDRAGAAHPESASPLDASRADGPPFGFQAPKLLVLRGLGEKRVVAIDRAGDILTVPVGSLQPMPTLVAACAGTRPFWGAVILDGSPTFLVDLEELACPMKVQLD